MLPVAVLVYQLDPVPYRTVLVPLKEHVPFSSAHFVQVVAVVVGVGLGLGLGDTEEPLFMSMSHSFA
jgi:hypothetical protein